MATPFRIRLGDARFRGELLTSLEEGNCSAVQLPDGTVEVLHRDAGTEREARIELAFFVRAWKVKHPSVGAELLG